jgi:hypothetical protein
VPQLLQALLLEVRLLALLLVPAPELLARRLEERSIRSG